MSARSRSSSCRSRRAELTETIKELREGEVERINQERKEKIASLDLTEDQQEYWAGKYTVALNESGEIVSDQEEFDSFLANMKVKEELEEEESVESELVDKSKAATATKVKPEGEEDFDSMA